MGKSDNTTVLWIRNDLRLMDNQALAYAISLGKPIIPIFILEENVERWPMGSASKCWLHYALKDFAKQIEDFGLTLFFKKGKYPELILYDLVMNVNAECLVWNRSYNEIDMQRDDRVFKKMSVCSVNVKTFSGNVLFEPGSVLNKAKKPFRVFTPFYNHVKNLLVEKSVPIKKNNVRGYNLTGYSKNLDSLGLLSGAMFSQRLGANWDPSIQGGKSLLDKFIKEKIIEYSVNRNFPAEEGTSRLSPYLHFGQISVRQINDILVKLPPSIRDPFYRQIIWREFAWGILYSFPEIAVTNFKKEFENFEWCKDVELLNSWQQGMTGYPIVDAGMRELSETGWMHNRVRMIVGSFLTKNLMIHWLEGARWFWDNLIDADLANNSFGWQWIAGSGLDASPFFRILNPILQSEKYDPHGIYIKRYVPELRNVPTRWIHAPWTANESQLGLRLGIDYPEPIVSQTASKINSLRAYKRMKSKILLPNKEIKN